jgi:hypothetical protein
MIIDVWAVGVIRIDWRNQSTWRKPNPVPLYPPEIPDRLAWDTSQATAVVSGQLSAWAIIRSSRPLSTSAYPHWKIITNPPLETDCAAFFTLRDDCAFSPSLGVVQPAKLVGRSVSQLGKLLLALSRTLLLGSESRGTHDLIFTILRSLELCNSSPQCWLCHWAYYIHVRFLKRHRPQELFCVMYSPLGV